MREDFVEQMEKRLLENKKLTASGGLPEKWAPVVEVLGFYPWQVMAGLALVITGALFYFFPSQVYGLVRVVLLMEVG